MDLIITLDLPAPTQNHFIAEDHYELVEQSSRHLKRWSSDEKSYVFRLTKPNEVQSIADFQTILYNVIDSILTRTIGNAPPTDKVT